MDIKRFRTLTDDALRGEGFQEQSLLRKGQRVWTILSQDIVRFFQPHAYRRPLGFVFSSTIGIEIPTLREWLIQNKSGEDIGIFHSCFAGYLILNEDILNNFMVCHGEPVPADLWAGLLKDRIERFPSSLDGLLSAYRGNREDLGWLAHPHQQPYWDFLEEWQRDPDPNLRVPRMTPTGQIV